MENMTRKEIAELLKNDSESLARVKRILKGEGVFYSRASVEQLNNAYNQSTVFKKVKINQKKLADFPYTSYESDSEYFTALENAGFTHQTIRKHVTELRKQGHDVSAYGRTKEINEKSERIKYAKTVVNEKVSAKKLNLMIEELGKNARSLDTRYLYLLLVTGRRSGEIIGNAFTEFDKKNRTVLFNNQSKLKGREKKSYRIPVLGCFDRFEEHYKVICENEERWKSNRSQMLFRALQPIKKYLKEQEDSLMTVHSLRTFYVKLANMQFNAKADVNELVYYSKLLGHTEGDLSTQNHYKVFSITTNDESIVKSPVVELYGYNEEKASGVHLTESESRAVKSLIDLYEGGESNKFHNTPEYRGLNSKSRNKVKEIFTKN